MNPRILKKLSKCVAAIGRPKNVYIELQLDHMQNSDYSPRHASRKPSHREKPWHRETYADGRPMMGDMYAWKGTPWYCWADHGPDGTEHDGRVAWQYMEEWVRGNIENDALDWDHPSCDEGGWPPFKDGKKPKYPRNTWSMLVAIEAACNEKYMVKL